ncbi:MAG: MlaD family protein [Gemmatimonadota bacterium]|nr:MlaD family protein [Gemmatimonadota bacterium]
MPRGAEKSWSELRVGIAVVAVAALAGLVVFFAGARRGPFLPDTYPLYVELSEAGGIRVGSPVRVGGVSAGEVADVSIIPAESSPPPEASDTLRPLTEMPDMRDIRIELSIQQRFRPYITSGSQAQLASIGLGGERYVKVSAGEAGQPALEPGEEIPARASIDWDLLLAKLSRAFNEMGEIAATSDRIRVQLAEGEGSLPRFIDPDASLYARVAAVQRESRSLLATLEGGAGIVPRWSADPRLQRSLDRLAADLGDLVEELEREDGALHRWVEAEELREALEGTRAELARLDEAVESGDGTLGRLVHDEELWVQIRVLQRRTEELVEAIQSDPLAFIDIDLF